MSDYERPKYYGKKKFSSTSREPSISSSSGRSFQSKVRPVSPGGSIKPDKEFISGDVKLKQPTILLKARDKDLAEETSMGSSVGAGSRRKDSEKEPHTIGSILPTIPGAEVVAVPDVKSMTRSVKFLEESTLQIDSLQEYVQENTDFLVVGILGAPSVGKSTVMNLLAHNRVTENLKKAVFKNLDNSIEEQYGDVKVLDKMALLTLTEGEVLNEVFKVQSSEDVEKNQSGTNGIDCFINSNRMIFLDCQPISSVSALYDLIENEHQRSNLVSEFIALENSGEIQSLQHAAFLMSVCHILIVVQDWFFDSNIVRFIQTAEMLKPSMSSAEDEAVDHSPHLILLHNKASMEDFTPRKFNTMQKIYKAMFGQSKLHLTSNLGLGSGTIINHLNSTNCGAPINLYLLPFCDPNSNNQVDIYKGHPGVEELIKRLKVNMLGATKNPLTHVQLTEKTWLTYCSKVWDTVKKSPFFVEYTKLMP